MQKYGLDRVLLTWETSEINETTCEFYACDAVQTSIMLFKRITTSNTGEIDAFLIKDNYSEKFKQDFSLHYGSVFYSSKEMRISNCINNKQR